MPLLNGFRLIRCLGVRDGGAWLACEGDRRCRPRWVIKHFPAPLGSSLRGKLRADFLDLACLRHPALSVPQGFGLDPDSGRPYLLRSFIEGAAVDISLGSIAAGDLRPWLLAMAEALAALHRAGFAHGAIKPSNFIAVNASLHANNRRPPKVVLCDPAPWPGGGGAGSSAGAPPPAAEPPSFGADLRSLGRLFYCLLAGMPPLPGARGATASPEDLNPQVSPDVSRVVMKLLDLDDPLGYRDADVLCRDLRRLCRLRTLPQTLEPVPEAFARQDLAKALGSLEVGVLDGGPVPLVAVGGEACSGKSTFLRRLALEAQLLGYKVVETRAFHDAPRLELIDAVLRKLFAASPRGRPLRTRWRRFLARRRAGGRREPRGTGAPQPLLGALAPLLDAAGLDRRCLLILDDIHLADEFTLELVAAWAKARRSGLVISYRTESPYRRPLKPLLESLRSRAQDHVAIELASPPGGPPAGAAERTRASALHAKHLESLGADERALLEAVAVLGRPAPLNLLRMALAIPARRLKAALASQLEQDALRESGGAYSFRHGSFQLWLSESLPRRRKQGLHRRIAAWLQGRRDASVEEVARHWLASDMRGRGIEPALAAARLLARAHQHAAALRFWEPALVLLEKRQDPRWRDAAREAAECSLRAAEYRRGVELLRKLLEDEREPLEAGRLHGRLGVQLHRAGESSKAVHHLEKGLSLLSAPANRKDPHASLPDRSVLRDRLKIQSELAEIASYRGELSRAESLCRSALGELGARRDAELDEGLRRERMVLLETLAHLCLRRFEYAAARRCFEQSLSSARGLPPGPERSLILNNLGTLHTQENRFRQAVACYHESRRNSRKLGDDQSLVVVESNLAALHAKLGSPAAADEAIALAAEHDSRCESPRARFLRLHNTGIVDLLLGRYASGIDTFQAAISLGEELQDRFLVAFEFVYLGECHLFRGEDRAAQAALERWRDMTPGAPTPIPAMAAARLALLAAARSEVREARALLERETERGTAGAAIPYLRAGNGIFRGWAFRLLGDAGEAARELEDASSFFRRIKAPLGEVHAEIELAAIELDAGLEEPARKRLSRLRRRFVCGEGALRNPMLSARLLLQEARLALEGPSPDADAAGLLLVEAGGFLIGRGLRDLESLDRSLRRRVRLLRLERGAPDNLPPAMPAVAGSRLDMDEVRADLSELRRAVFDELEEKPAQGLARRIDALQERMAEAQRAEESRSGDTPPAAAAALEGPSRASRDLVKLVRRVAASNIPILITGETGSGKELVARAIHGESLRRRGPFLPLSSAAIPEALLEAELFGFRHGAFTGAEEDRSGLLESARGGTVFLDEVAEMPLSVQAKVLRALESGKVRPLGATEEVELDVRVIAATCRDLTKLAEEGAFRRDLYFRIRGIEVVVPPLRERLEDLPGLAAGLLEQAAGRRPGPRLEESALRALAAYPWPGNIRELANVAANLSLTAGESITASDVERVLRKMPLCGLFPAPLLRSRPLPALARELEKEYILQLCGDLQGDLKAVSRRLGITRRALYARFHRLGIDPRGLR